MNKKLLLQLDQLGERWKALQPVPAAIARAAREHWILEWVYNSNALSGNSLDLRQTDRAMSQVMIGGKPLQEVNDVVNHKLALLLLEQELGHPVAANPSKRNGKAAALSEKTVLGLFKIFNKGTGKLGAPGFRKQELLSQWPELGVLDVAGLPDAVRTLIADCSKNKRGQSAHPLIRAVSLHCKFIAISPFARYNHRIARLLLLYELLRNQYPPMVIPVSHKDSYVNLTIQAIQTNKVDDLAEYIAQRLVSHLQDQVKQLSRLREGFF